MVLPQPLLPPVVLPVVVGCEIFSLSDEVSVVVFLGNTFDTLLKTFVKFSNICKNYYEKSLKNQRI
jgi:hypothetical protein